MGGPSINDSIRGLAWGTAAIGSLGAPGKEAVLPTASPSGHAPRWAGDVAEVVGVSPDRFRAVLGWPHLQPDGPGHWDAGALDRCDRALDLMLAAGIAPSLTLLHVQLPGWLERAGGWLVRDTAWRFADYAAEMAARFGDRVGRWVTSGDFIASTIGEHVAGLRPSSRGLGEAGLPAVHHLMLGHGLATRAIRAEAPGGSVGGATPLTGNYAASGDPWDRIALEQYEAWSLRLLLDPLLLGRHMILDDGTSPVEATGCVRSGDLEIISTPQDFLTLSWSGVLQVAAPENLVRVLPALPYFEALNDVNRLISRLGFVFAPLDGVATTTNGWPIMPEALADAVAAVHDIYGDRLPPLWITDRGVGDLDTDGPPSVIGARRRALLASRLGWLANLMAEGVEVIGYEYWSFMDDFDWFLPYARLYGMAVPDGDPVAQPAIPCDWVRGEAFGLARTEVGPAAEAVGLRVLRSC